MNKPLRIFFFGTPAIAVPSLEALAQDPQVEIVGVGVFPDRPVGRKQVLTPCPVKVSAQDLNLPIYELKDKQALIDITNEIDYDLGVVIAFGMIFPESVLSTPTVNVHFSLLPAYRGASPVQSAILNGDTVSGITWQRMVKALDAGDVLWQKEYDITNQSTAELWQYFSTETADHFPAFITDYLKGIEPVPQDPEQATFCGKFTRADGEVFPETQTANEIYIKYLAFDPWPGIFMETDAGRLKILQASRASLDNTYELPCANDTILYLKTVQKAGKTPQTAQSFYHV